MNAGRAAGLWGTARRAGIGAVGLVAAWAMGFFGPDLWESAKEVAGQDPLGVAILRDYQVPTSAEFHFNEVIVPGPLSKFPVEPFDERESDKPPALPPGWDYSSTEVDAMTTAVRLVITGNRASSVIIQQISVRVLSRRQPVRGMIAAASEGGQGEAMEIRYLRADLDSGKLAWRTGENKPIAPQALMLGHGDQVIIDLVAMTMKCDCDWVIDVTYSAASDNGTLTVPSKGHFRTSALNRAAVWDEFTGPRPTCKDFRDLKPTLCDGLPSSFEGEKMSVIRPSRSGKYATGYGLMIDDE